MRKILVTFIFFSSLIIFFALANSFFQQDEWHSFGFIQAHDFSYVTLNKPLWQLFFADRSGARFIMYILFQLFGLWVLPYGIFAATIHVVNTYLVFLLTKKLIKNTTGGLISGAFFLVNSVGHQAYSWFGTMAGSVPSATFLLLSLIFYLHFLEKRILRWFFLSIFFIWVSFLFKESGFFIFLLYPLFWFFVTEKKTLKTFFQENSVVLFYGCIMTIILAMSIIFISGNRANYISPDAPGIVNFLTHALLYPFEGIVQIFLPPDVIFSLATVSTKMFVPSILPDTSDFDLYYSTIMAENISLVLAFFFTTALIFFYKKILVKSEESFRISFIFSILFLILSFIPYIVLGKFDAYLDSRYYYVPAIGASLLFGILLNKLKNKAFASLILFTVFFIHAFFLLKDLTKQVIIGRERQAILHQVMQQVPEIKEKTVFFVDGNSPGYYGLPELKVPFQSGLGQVLMVIYVTKKQVDPILFKENTFSQSLDAGFLYDTLAQGYKSQDNQLFGFFYDKNELKKALGRKEFSDKDIIFLYYDTDTKSIERKRFTL